MKTPTSITTQALPRLLLSSRGASVATTIPVASRAAGRTIHSSTAAPADVAPFSASGPPPGAPQPAVEHPYAKIERRRRQADLLKNAKEIRDAASGKNTGKVLRRRFWKDVHIKEVDGAIIEDKEELQLTQELYNTGSYQIHLDTRPLRHPGSKEIINIPLSKPYLAHALALEWDLITSAKQATQQHLIPLTSLICRALDIAEDDAAHAHPTSPTPPPVRNSVVTNLLRYLDTDSLLCWAPSPAEPPPPGELTLRELQARTAAEVIGHLSARVWPGIEIEPVLDDSSFLPKSQKPGVREVVQGWAMGLDAWELVGLERATLAAKSLLGAARLVVEWSEGAAGLSPVGAGEQPRFGVEEAARAASLEVDWQTRKWGEVEDTHDVEKEDVRRQLGSVVLLVSGSGSW
ncbi:ATP synthase mitochondrial F1 complex assembly factor 2 [Cytospora paraplurivora]|uniref:ATP synthase mitochondrial F1 complex assembly factor 2 n=1 Tax=Cytospora paraplurivora TaxID=2898453 RepID=A0AAN9U4B4_9PEZI